MRRKRIKNKTKKSINLLLYICILLSTVFSIKHVLFNKKDFAQASQQNLELSNKPPNQGYISSYDNNFSTEYDIEIENDDISIKQPNENIDESKTKNNSNSNDEISLENSAFIGDSITEALSYYKFIDSSKVIAHKGYTARKALSDINKIVQLKPDNIFIMLGLNDILIERSVDRFINNYTNLINELKKNLPDTNIYIQSILPIGPQVKSSKLALSNAQIEEFNDGLKAFANQNNITYLDVASVIDNYEDLHEPDGIHYKSKFCNIWLEYIKENIQNQ